MVQAEIENEDAKSKAKALTNKVGGIIRVMRDNSQDTTFTTTANDFLDSFEHSDSVGEHLKPETVVKAIMSAIKTKQMEEKSVETEFVALEKELQKTVDKLR